MEPISRREFQEANESMVKSIKSHIDEKFESHEKFEEERYQTSDKVQRAHSATLYGDAGDDSAVGLRIQVDRLYTRAKAAYVIVGGMFTGVMAWLGLK